VSNPATVELVDWALESVDPVVTAAAGVVVMAELLVFVATTEDVELFLVELLDELARTTNLSPTSELPAVSVMLMKNVPPTVALFPGVQAYEFEVIAPVWVVYQYLEQMIPREWNELRKGSLLAITFTANGLLVVPFSNVRMTLPLYPDQVMANGTPVTMFDQVVVNFRAASTSTTQKMPRKILIAKLQATSHERQLPKWW
jgi:hypothetical protein